jgi:hypothetical protein
MTNASIAASSVASFALALAVAPTARADDRTLHLAVHGSIDSARLGPAIAKELGVDVAVIEGTCDLPCLDIAVDGSNTATIVFVPRSGSLRQRAVKLGTNTGQWPLVITLLAGNVVRDESRDLLAGLPPSALPGSPAPGAGPADVPPAPEEAGRDGPPITPESAPAAQVEDPAMPAPSPVADREPAHEHRFLALGLVPVLSTDLLHVGSVQHFLSIHALVGVSGGSSGVSLGGVADIQRGLVAGFQAAGIFSAARDVAGTQVAGVAAVAGDMDGVQVAGTAAVADRVRGFQAAGVAAYSNASADTQVAGVVVAARGSARTQIAGVSTTAGGDADVQISGVSNVARGTASVQISGVVNVARSVHGVQIGTINISPHVDGVQIGIVNVGSADGFSLGLINIVPGGRYDLEAAADSSQTGTLLFRHGGRRWHNVYGVAGHRAKETSRSDGANDDVWMYGFGFGPSMSFGNTVVDLEAISWQVNHGARHESDVSVLGQLRLSVAHRFGPFAIVAGGAFNAYVTSDQQSPLVLERRSSGAQPMDDRVTVTMWPSAFVGLRL